MTQTSTSTYEIDLPPRCARVRCPPLLPVRDIRRRNVGVHALAGVLVPPPSHFHGRKVVALPAFTVMITVTVEFKDLALNCLNLGVSFVYRPRYHYNGRDDHHDAANHEELL